MDLMFKGVIMKRTIYQTVLWRFECVTIAH